MSWSSLDWDRGRWYQIDLVIGTLFDALIHAMNSFLLMQHFSSMGSLFVSVMVTFILSLLVMFNPKLAWANPAAKIPEWIKLRMRPLTEDERQEIQVIEQIGSKLLITQQTD